MRNQLIRRPNGISWSHRMCACSPTMLMFRGVSLTHLSSGCVLWNRQDDADSAARDTGVFFLVHVEVWSHGSEVRSGGDLEHGSECCIQEGWLPGTENLGISCMWEVWNQSNLPALKVGGDYMEGGKWICSCCGSKSKMGGHLWLTGVHYQKPGELLHSTENVLNRYSFHQRGIYRMFPQRTLATVLIPANEDGNGENTKVQTVPNTGRYEENYKNAARGASFCWWLMLNCECH